ncbi:hypothetical protein OGR47_07485 [Methylocystis sp. MJC1]|nr:hypothetical protein [Methylocystis sp. MJC1]UZX13271.1 hypothetical protein OGR47_07485 [Methylocystis sp. MJC1]
MAAAEIGKRCPTADFLPVRHQSEGDGDGLIFRRGLFDAAERREYE